MNEILSKCNGCKYGKKSIHINGCKSAYFYNYKETKTRQCPTSVYFNTCPVCQYLQKLNEQQPCGTLVWGRLTSDKQQIIYPQFAYDIKTNEDLKIRETIEKMCSECKKEHANENYLTATFLEVQEQIVNCPCKAECKLKEKAQKMKDEGKIEYELCQTEGLHPIIVYKIKADGDLGIKYTQELNSICDICLSNYREQR